MQNRQVQVAKSGVHRDLPMLSSSSPIVPIVPLDAAGLLWRDSNRMDEHLSFQDSRCKLSRLIDSVGSQEA